MTAFAAVASVVKELPTAAAGDPLAALNGFAERVYEQIVPETGNVNFPCAILTAAGVPPAPATPSDTEGGQQEQVVRVLLVEKATRLRHDLTGPLLAWQAAAVAALMGPKLPARLPGLIDWTVTPTTVSDEWLFGCLVAEVCVRLSVRVPYPGL